MVPMSIKVLVFESDSAFAGELRNELGKLGCAIRVVDDGNVGLQQAQAERPDLILLSIELPRMNGFSVCNKLKKDPDLKDVPLIIMSSESSDETFEQHKKLRTRAEAYVRKPIAFGDLRREIESFVDIGRAADVLASTGDRDDANGINIDEDAEPDVPVEPERAPDSGKTAMFQVPVMPHKPRQIDADVEAFADDAFGRLQGEPPPALHPATRPLPAEAREGQNGKTATPTRPPPVEVAADAVSSGDPEELDRARTEIQAAAGERDQANARAVELEEQLRNAQEEVARVRKEAEAEAERLRTESEAEADRLRRDLEELRSRPAGKAGSVPPKGIGGVSSREFLDLRETLSKKDKEILALKQQLTVKDKETFEARDRSLAHEGRVSELDDKVLAKDRELAETSEKIEELTGQLGTATRGLADTQTSLERALRELEEVRAKRDQENVTNEAAIAAMKADRAEALARMKTEHVEALAGLGAEHADVLRRLGEEHTAALEHATTAARAEMDAATEEHTAALEKAAREHAELVAQHAASLDDTARAHAEALATERSEAEERLAAAIGTRESELKSETDTKLASLHRSQQDELQRLRTDAEGKETALQNELARAKAQIEEQGRSMADLGARTSALETQLGAAASKAAALEEELGTLRGELDETRKNLVRESSRATRAMAKWEADRASLERAKDALAVALSQLDEAEARQISE